MIQKSPKHQLSDEALEMVAARFKALSEKTRLKLIIALEDGEKNVGELVKRVGANQAIFHISCKSLQTPASLPEEKMALMFITGFQTQVFLNFANLFAGV